MQKRGIKTCHTIHQQATCAAKDLEWPSVRKHIKQQVTDMRHDVWSQHQKNLLQQGHMLQLLEEEKCDLTHRRPAYLLYYLATWGKRSSDRCKLCGNRETLHHVLNHCSVSLQQGRYTFRHNAILKHITDSIQDAIDLSQITATVYADIQGHTTNGGTLPVHILPTTQKPDLVTYLREQNTIHIQELTVPFEQNIKTSHDRKVNKYAALAADLRTTGITTTLTCFEI
ncbi:glucuronosyltransferase [Branchiostoma belcheri]|nr:glucuronosyltransferase [Branchiostoma belcheri]